MIITIIVYGYWSSSCSRRRSLCWCRCRCWRCYWCWWCCCYWRCCYRWYRYWLLGQRSYHIVTNASSYSPRYYRYDGGQDRRWLAGWYRWCCLRRWRSSRYRSSSSQSGIHDHTSRSRRSCRSRRSVASIRRRRRCRRQRGRSRSRRGNWSSSLRSCLVLIQDRSSSSGSSKSCCGGGGCRRSSSSSCRIGW